jgi:uncharacterized membrane protein YedE/YeeE
MKETGILLIALGVVACIVAFFITTSTHVGYVPSLTYNPLNPYASPPMPSDVVNLWGLHVQGLFFQGGFAAIIAGSVLYGFGTVDETLKRNAGVLPKPASPPPPPAVPVYEDSQVEEEKPDHSTIWIAVIGLGIIAFIILAILAASKPTTDTGTNVDTNMDGNVGADTNMVMDNFLATPRTARRRH